ncbi:MAG: hypothetical protein JW889_16515 [Verrucomicrobia bacterium]|nr:hypothetical protein [Verrucomicrobiota bacterium]
MEQSRATPTKATWPARLAFALSAVMSPVFVATAAMALAVLKFTSGAAALSSLVVMVVFGSAFGMALAYVRARRKGLSDLHIHERRDRPGFFLLCMAAALAGEAVLAVMRSPVGVLVFMGAYAACLGLIALTTLATKPSVHCATMTAFAGALLVVEPIGVPFAAAGLVGLVWARLHRRRHTLAQCLYGIAIGVATVAGAYLVWRALG